MKGNLREADKQEVWAMSHVDADYALQQSVEASVLTWTGMQSNKPFTICGVAPASLEGMGRPWLLATHKIEACKLYLLRMSKPLITEMFDHFQILENFVDKRNTLSIDWLKWCGFIIEDPAPMGLDQMLFHRFWMER